MNDKKTVNNYPYGRLKATAYFSLDFDKKKGFRSVFQTINPKNGVLNKPKKGTYNDIMYLSDTDGFIKFHSIHFYEVEKFNDVTAWLHDNFSLFTSDQSKYFYSRIIGFLKLQVYSYHVYCNVDTEKSIPLIDPAMKKALEGFKDPNTNVFNDIKIDHVALEALKDPNYNPFTVRTVEYNDK